MYPYSEADQEEIDDLCLLEYLPLQRLRVPQLRHSQEGLVRGFYVGRDPTYNASKYVVD